MELFNDLLGYALIISTVLISYLIFKGGLSGKCHRDYLVIVGVDYRLIHALTTRDCPRLQATDGAWVGETTTSSGWVYVYKSTRGVRHATPATVEALCAHERTLSDRKHDAR